MDRFLLRLSNLGKSVIIAIFIFIYHSVQAVSTSYCQTHRITISASNIPLELVFKKIKQQTGISIHTSLQESELNAKKKVTVNFHQADLTEVMTFLLNDRKNLSYAITDHNIFIFKRQELNIQNSYLSTKIDTLSNAFDLSGKIVDKDGNPIPGASIKLKTDIKRGTISNADGSFRLSDVSKGSIVIFSSIGFESKEIITDSKNILVELKSHTNLLDEKVVIAYGSTTKRLNTGNIGSLKAIDIEKQPVNNPLLALQGRVAGIFIEQSSGLPGSGVTVRIQGVNSYFSGKDPFYVIDGVPFISQLLSTRNTIGGSSGVSFTSGSPFNYLSSADIESIEVLKDADATAIYGSKAANGAVLITTKKGKIGPTRVNLTYQSGWSRIQQKMNVLNTKEYLEMRHEALSNDNTAISPFDYELNGTWDTTRNIDWQKQLIGGTAKYIDAQFGISGGTTVTQYLFGAGYHKETTVFPGSFSDSKASVHFNLINNSPNQKFRLQFTGSFVFDDNKLPLSDLTINALSLPPVAPDPNLPDGSINWAPNVSGTTTYFSNPLATNAQKSSNKTSNLTSNVVLSYEIFPGLTIKSSFGYNSLLTNEITKAPLSSINPDFRIYYSNTSTFITNRTNSWIIEPQAELQKKIGRGNLDILLGSTLTQLNNDQQSLVAYGFNNELIMEDLASAPNIYGQTINSLYKYNAIYSRVSYNWLDKYIINLSARRDGSSRFGPKSQFHNFGAIGTAWIFSQEPFFQSKMPTISYGKLRASYGTTGNDQIGDYQFMDVYQSLLVSGNAYQNILGLVPTRLTNPYLQWEETKKFQVGLDLGILKDRIIFAVNYNQNRSSNQLLGNTLPNITGFGGITKNFPAVIQNSGWELTLSTTNIKREHFSWTANFNITIPKNQVLSYKGLDKNTSIFIGKPLSLQIFYDYIGVNDTTGRYQFRDAKGNATYTPSDPIDKIIGLSTDPKFYGGFQNSFVYKEFSLDIFFSFTKKLGIDNFSYGLNGLYPGSYLTNQITRVLDRWQKPGDKATIEPYSTGKNANLNFINNSDAIIVDASYIRLKNVSVSWQLPEHWKRTLHFQNARLFLNAQNLFTITNYTGLDPETYRYSLPPLRTISIGAQITL
jgi:TonB-linked SusC/RagA family outer membrane protein